MPTFTPTTLAFGNIGTGRTSAQKTLTVVNETASDITLSATGYAFSPGKATKRTSHPPARKGDPTTYTPTTTHITVTFAPSAVQAYPATITSGAATLTLSGAGVQTFSVASLSFGRTALSTTSPAQTVTVTPDDGETINLTESGFIFAPSAITGAATSVTVQFSPSEVKNYSKTFAHAPASFSVSGEGAATFSPAVLAFGKQAINTSASRLVTVTNTTGAAIDLSATGFTFNPASVPNGQMVVVTVTFSPTAVQSYTPAAIVKTGGSLTVSGEGVASAAEIESSYVETDGTAANVPATQKFWEVELDYKLPSAPSTDDQADTYLRIGTSVLTAAPTATGVASENVNDHTGLDLASMVTTDSSALHTDGGWRDHTDTNHISTTRGDKVDVVRRQRRIKIGSSTASPTEPSAGGESEPYKISVYKPKDQSASGFTIPDFLNGVAGTPDPIHYADQVEVHGSRKLKVHDLLAEEVRGDRASYVRGDNYQFVRGKNRVVIDGDDDSIDVSGDKTTEIHGNTTETMWGEKKSTIHGSSESTIYGSSITTVHGSKLATDLGAATGITLGVSTTIRLGLVLSGEFAVKISLTLGFAFSITTAQFALNGFKGEWTHMKYDAGVYKIGAFSADMKKAGMEAHSKDIAVAYSTLGLANIAVWLKTGSLSLFS